MRRGISHTAESHNIRSSLRETASWKKLRDNCMFRIVHDQLQSNPIGEYDRTAGTATGRGFFQSQNHYRNTVRIASQIVVILTNVLLNDR